MRRAAGRTAHAQSYKYTHMLAFMKKFFRRLDVNAYPEAEEEEGEAFPVHMSLAKAENFTVVNKHELKRLMESGRWPADGNASL